MQPYTIVFFLFLDKIKTSSREGFNDVPLSSRATTIMSSLLCIGRLIACFSWKQSFSIINIVVVAVCRRCHTLWSLQPNLSRQYITWQSIPSVRLSVVWALSRAQRLFKIDVFLVSTLRCCCCCSFSFRYNYDSNWCNFFSPSLFLFLVHLSVRCRFSCFCFVFGVWRHLRALRKR